MNVVSNYSRIFTHYVFIAKIDGRYQDREEQKVRILSIVGVGEEYLLQKVPRFSSCL